MAARSAAAEAAEAVRRRLLYMDWTRPGLLICRILGLPFAVQALYCDL